MRGSLGLFFMLLKIVNERDHLKLLKHTHKKKVEGNIFYSNVRKVHMHIVINNFVYNTTQEKIMYLFPHITIFST